MRPPRTAAEVRALLEPRGLWASRARGQNFLVDPRHLAPIVEAASVREGDVVLEVGTGLATLTDLLAASGASVVTVELDHGLADVARDILADREGVTLVEGDALARSREAERPALSDAVERALARARAESRGRFVVASNLPYSSASPLLLAFLDREPECAPDRVVVLVQKEVAGRMLAEPATRDYSLLGVSVGYFATVRRERDYGPGAFWPPPKIRSTLLVLEPGRGFGPSRDLYPSFRDVASALFSARRKKAAGALRRLFGDETAAAMAAAGLSETVRADAVPPRNIVELARQRRAASRPR